MSCIAMMSRQRFRAVARFRAGDFRRAVVRRAPVLFLAVVFLRAVVFFRAAVFFRAVLLRLVALRAVDLRAVLRAPPPLAVVLRTALVRLFRALLMCVWTSRTALRASPSTFAVAFLMRFSSASKEVLSALRPPPLGRRELVDFLDDAERPLALRLVLLRAVVLRAPPVFLPAVLRLAVLRAAGDIELLSLGGR